MKIKKLLFALALIVTGVVALSAAGPKAQALSGSSFNPGRIIDDSVFFNKDAMSVNDIQNFIYNKSGNCNTNRPTTDSRYQPPWTCLYQYRENTTTKVNNIGSPGSNPAGSITAAQIIYDAAQQYTISPRSLLVLIQKESSLVTDNWPWSNQYRSATGYGCPDGAPCDSQYFGFYNQVNRAAFQLRRYATFPNEYNVRAGRNNNISFHPSGNCGAQTVFVQNAATAGLYNYTPYVPNASALNNLYGIGDNCSSYGNRNFWRLYNDWFGSTIAPAYSWSVVEQQAKKYVTGENIDISTGVPSGERVVFYIRAQNTGTVTWTNSGANPTRIGSSNPQDRRSAFCEVSWIACHRPVAMEEASVAPGAVGTFQFAVQMPLAPGQYAEYFNLMSEGVTWMRDIGLHFNVKVVPASLTYDLISSTFPAQMVSGQTYDGTVTLKNTGNTAWYNIDKYPMRLGTASPYDRTSPFYASTWFARTRAVNQGEFRVLPQANATFSFSLKAPATNGTYTENFAPMQEGYQWGPQSIPLNFTVTGGAAQVASILDNGQSLTSGQSIASPDGRYKLFMQGDGNLVLYSPNRAIWNTATQGRPANRLVVQGDGNMVVYGPSTHYWNTRTQGNGNVRLALQSDGNLVLYDAQNRAVWNTGTQGRL